MPLALGTIWSYAYSDTNISNRYELVDVFWQEESVTDILNSMINPDVLMCSCYVWNWKKTYEVIKQVKSNFPECLIVIGGPEPQYTSEWINHHPEVDVLVAHYGELTFKNILNVFAAGSRNFDRLAGVVTASVNNKNIRIEFDLNEIPSPYLNGFFDQLLVRKHANIKSIRTVFETNRGCPYSCSYCDLGAVEYQKIKAYHADRCLRELDWIVKNNISVIDVSDSNFGMFPRDEKFVDHLIHLKNKYNYKGSFLPTWSKTKGKHTLDIGKKIIKSGLDSIYNISIQSPNNAALSSVNRKNAFKFEELSEVIKNLSEDGVPVYTDLIFPLPGDTYDSYISGLNRLLDLEFTFNKVQMNHLSRISNSSLANQDSIRFDVKWVNILGNSRHYFGNQVEDTIATSNKYINEEEVFEANFYSKCLIQPLYYYGLCRNLCNVLHHKKIMMRSQVISLIYEKLLTEDWFLNFKKNMRDHYFSAIQNFTHFGHRLDDTNQYYPEYAKSYLFFIENNIFPFLHKEFQDFHEIIKFDEYSTWNNKMKDEILELKDWNTGVWRFTDLRQLEESAYFSQVFIRGRFSDEWRVQTINQI